MIFETENYPAEMQNLDLAADAAVREEYPASWTTRPPISIDPPKPESVLDLPGGCTIRVSLSYRTHWTATACVLVNITAASEDTARADSLCLIARALETALGDLRRFQAAGNSVDVACCTN